MIKIESKKEGGELISIKKDGKEYLHDGKEFWNRHAPILFPIVGMIKDNKTSILGKTYEMKQHGFARDMEFEEVLKSENEVKYYLKYNEETLKRYPFKFELNIIYKIDNLENSISTIYEVKNIDDKEIIFGLGAHPAFKCDYSSGDYYLKFEKEHEDENIVIKQLTEGLINSKEIDTKSIIKNNIIELKKDIFDKDAIIMTNINSSKIKLINKKENKEVLEFDFTGFPYLAIWSKKGAPFVCIEPWFNTADKIDSNGIFEEKEDLIELKPEKIFRCEYKVKLF